MTTQSNDRTCPGCLGSGRVRRYDVIRKTSEVLACDVCGGSGSVQGSVSCSPARVSGTVHVLNPGDPGYDEAKRRLEERT
jgi:DnaJ-class molecular chaperone